MICIRLMVTLQAGVLIWIVCEARHQLPKECVVRGCADVRSWGKSWMGPRGHPCKTHITHISEARCGAAGTRPGDCWGAGKKADSFAALRNDKAKKRNDRQERNA